MLDVSFWENRYESENTPWDLAGPSPHFLDLLASGPDFLVPGQMAVLGAGRGHDAALFARNGFEVTGFDYAPEAVRLAGALYGSDVRFIQADVFTLADPDSGYVEQFDYVLEHTCFCAILPEQRAAYARSAAALLKPGGYLLGVFWEHPNTDGPPFSTTQEQVHACFDKGFDLISAENRKAVDGRGGIERLIVLRRKVEL